MARRGVAGLLCTMAVAAGCASTPADEAPAQQSPPTASAPRRVDLRRLAEVRAAFPAGYVALPLSGPRTVDPQFRDLVGDFVGYGKPLTVTPDACRTLLKPVHAVTETETVSVGSDSGPQDPFVTVAVHDPVSTTAEVPREGCERFGFVAQSVVPDGAVQQVAAPTFADSVTFGLKVVFTVDDEPVGGALVEYFYTAILDGRTFVTVWARVPSEFSAESVLPDLLTKAVTAIRGA